EVADTILIDPMANGFGWFIDTTPLEDSEFGAGDAGGTLRAAVYSPAFGRMDLLTVVMHELGHAFGLEDLDAQVHPDELMAETLAVGIRRTTAYTGHRSTPTPVATESLVIVPAPFAIPDSPRASAGAEGPAVHRPSVLAQSLATPARPLDAPKKRGRLSMDRGEVGITPPNPTMIDRVLGDLGTPGSPLGIPEGLSQVLIDQALEDIGVVRGPLDA